MPQEYFQDQTFHKIDFQDHDVRGNEYDKCIFDGCNLSRINLSDSKFIDCTFKNCDLSLAILSRTSMQEVFFGHCKLMGINFTAINSFGLSLSFDNCQLQHSVFRALKLKGVQFKSCQLQEVDFSTTDLSSSVFDDCNLERTLFQQSNLEKANLLTSFNYTIDPENNRLKKAKFSIWGLEGLLRKYDITVSK